MLQYGTLPAHGRIIVLELDIQISKVLKFKKINQEEKTKYCYKNIYCNNINKIELITKLFYKTNTYMDTLLTYIIQL